MRLPDCSSPEMQRRAWRVAAELQDPLCIGVPQMRRMVCWGEALKDRRRALLSQMLTTACAAEFRCHHLPRTVVSARLSAVCSDAVKLQPRQSVTLVAMVAAVAPWVA